MPEAPAPAKQPSAWEGIMTQATSAGAQYLAQRQARKDAAADEATARAEEARAARLRADIEANRMVLASQTKVPGWIWAAAVAGGALLLVTLFTRKK